MLRNVAQDAALELLRQQVLEPSLWRRLNPGLSVAAAGAAMPPDSQSMGPDELDAAVRQFGAEGYVQTRPILSPGRIARMRDCIMALERQGWPAIFGFMYDDFWLVAREIPVQQVASIMLGPVYRQIPHIWTYDVRPDHGAAGWAPHVDAHQRPHRITVWLPLTEATLDNGCMYIIPRDRISDAIRSEYVSRESFSKFETNSLLQGSRALPAQPGAVLSWEQELIHWGGMCTRPGARRLAIAIEFLASEVHPLDDELPLLDVDGPLPSLAQRLTTIGRAIYAYAGFEATPAPFGALAEMVIRQHTG